MDSDTSKMLSSTAHEHIHLDEDEETTFKKGGLATRKIWLPKVLYDGLPYFYLTAGFAAFFATLYISEWFWVLPHYLMFSAACVQLGIYVYRRRRSQQRPPPATSN
jgi:hypothetical protein